MMEYWVDLSSIIAAAAAVVATLVALCTLPSIAASSKKNSLAIILDLESELRACSRTVDEKRSALQEALLNAKDDELVDIIDDSYEIAVETYLNTLERLCFCFTKRYVKEVHWKDEYQKMLEGIISTYPDYFNGNSTYHHILLLRDRWRGKPEQYKV
ncbi:MAG: hypothetical protein AAF975_05020 [Spirochaetota bacterium]